MQLENEELTPWRRLILQIKFSRIQTKLDEKITYLDVLDFEKQCKELKRDTIINVVNELEDGCREYREMADEQYKIETQIEQLMNNIKEIKKDANNTYKYQTKPENIVTIEEANKQLEDIMNKKEEKEQQIREIYEEGHQRYNQIDKTMNKKIMKYNPIVLKWNAIKTFFGHIAENVADWWQNKKIEKDAQKGLSKEEKKNSKMEIRRSTANMRNAENETIVENFRTRLRYDTIQNEPEENLQEKLGEPQEELEQEELQEIGQEVEQEELQENVEQETTMNPVLQLYIEESAKEGFDETKFFDKHAWSQDTTYTLGQIETGMEEIEHYKEEHKEEIRKRKIQEYFEKQEALRQELKEKRARLKGEKFEYKNNNYVPIENEMQKEEKTSTSQEKEQNEMGPILNQYIEEKSKPNFSREKFVKEIASANNTYSIEEKRRGMQEIDRYEQEKKMEQMANMNPVLKQYIEESAKEGFDKNDFMGKIKGSAKLTGREKLIAIKEIDNYIEQQKMSQEETEKQEKEQEEFDR